MIVQGWYRRSPVPYIEIRRFECDGVTRKSWTPFMYKLTAIVVSGIGISWLLWASGIDMLIKSNIHF